MVTLRAAGRASRDSAFNFTLHFPGDWDIAPPSISTNAKQICESQPAQSTLCATPERLIVSASPLAARGLYALKRGKEVDSHYERTYPPLYDASNRENRLAMYISHADSNEPKIDLILEFLRQRRIDHLWKWISFSNQPSFVWVTYHISMAHGGERNLKIRCRVSQSISFDRLCKVARASMNVQFIARACTTFGIYWSTRCFPDLDLARGQSTIL